MAFWSFLCTYFVRTNFQVSPFNIDAELTTENAKIADCTVEENSF